MKIVYCDEAFMAKRRERLHQTGGSWTSITTIFGMDHIRTNPRRFNVIVAPHLTFKVQNRF
jgi:hypothetical protein